MDLGADGLQTFRHVLLPQMATALLAGGILAFALSFDEIIVTTFTAGHERTLPIWMLNQLGRPRDVPVTNVVAHAGHGHHRHSPLAGLAPHPRHRAGGRQQQVT